MSKEDTIEGAAVFREEFHFKVTNGSLGAFVVQALGAFFIIAIGTMYIGKG